VRKGIVRGGGGGGFGGEKEKRLFGVNTKCPYT